MGMSMVGYLMYMPRDIQITSEAIEAKRLEQLKVAEPVLRYELDQAACAPCSTTSEDLPWDEFADNVMDPDHLDELEPDEIERILERLRSPDLYTKWIRDLEAELECSLDDHNTAWRVNPDNPEELLVFTGDATWGDTPDNPMYQATDLVHKHCLTDLFGIR